MNRYLFYKKITGIIMLLLAFINASISIGTIQFLWFTREVMQFVLHLNRSMAYAAFSIVITTIIPFFIGYYLISDKSNKFFKIEADSVKKERS